ncbi:hypothetical protein SISNIDRAFT_414320 [Sistotremastrum niveocremeum HHB9708]|uniref:BTB domain-containing protein n=1 Tax=Sistotremastrum niveocremeum HHB9708 TaxID=1314777 RepID=A0A164S6E2_9AGAM|nr:hypothetical protein SISNIDRAFT_414320 [Sistotremastrum niveocremeum HHB9708]
MDPEFTEGDFTIRSADGQTFRVFRAILAASSQFWKDLFSIPRPVLNSALDSPNTDDDVVDVSESALTVRTLLQFTYPISDPTITSLDHLVPVLEASLKFDMQDATSKLRKLLISPEYLQSSPTRVYAIACRFELYEEAKIASRETLRSNILDLPLSEDLKYISAYDYHRLLDLHRQRVAAALELLRITPNIKCPQCSLTHYGNTGTPKWWEDFDMRAKQELHKAPITDTIFSMRFLARSAVAGCQRCGASILESYDYLLEIKASIDKLPDTI